MLRRFRRSAPPGVEQVVSGAQIGGDNIMIGALTVVHGGRSAFRLTPLPAEAVRTPSVEQARAQPSRLLDARLGVVGFALRDRELAWLRAWRDEVGGPAVSVFLVHAEGGVGKTRLAGQFALESRDAGWTVWQAAYDPVGAVAPAPDEPGRGVLLVVDYAERWPMAQLQALLRHVAAGSAPVRVLMLARSAGTWWEALSYRLGRDDVAGRAHLLWPLARDPQQAGVLFTAARDRFADVLGVADAGTVAVPDLADDEYRLVLAVHMAALVAVDSRLHARDTPADPTRLSGYLLSRERAAWYSLPPDENQRPRSDGQALARTVYTAVLTGPLSYQDGTRALERVRLAATPEASAALLGDHGRLYPTRRPGTVLEPLYPDRLAEDFLALSTPAAELSGDLADPWAADAPARLLAPDDADDLPVWCRSGLSVLIEATGRWPHLGTNQLFPLLRAHPNLAAAAGRAALATLMGLDGLDLDLLHAIEAHLPSGTDFELDPGIVALTQRLTSDSLDAETAPAARARLLHRLGWRYDSARMHEQALPRLEETVALYRNVVDSDPDTYRPRLAHALEDLSACLKALYRRDDARAAVEEAVRMRRLAGAATPQDRADLAYAELLRGLLLDVHEALPVFDEVVRSYRELVAADPATHLASLAHALHAYGAVLADDGRWTAALPPAEEAQTLYRRLVATDRNAYLPKLATVLDLLAEVTSNLNRATG